MQNKVPIFQKVRNIQKIDGVLHEHLANVIFQRVVYSMYAKPNIFSWIYIFIFLFWVSELYIFSLFIYLVS